MHENRIRDVDAIEPFDRILGLDTASSPSTTHNRTGGETAFVSVYELAVESFPDVLIEDPELTDETRPILKGETERVTWDYPIHGVENVEELPWEPEWLNIKPSRFGSVRSLFETIEYCEDHDIRMFGGGQFELDVGREHIHAVASLFYPDGPNDIAPSEYNDPEPREGLPSSPLTRPSDPRGLRWRSDD
jgi:hypothetical protein